MTERARILAEIARAEARPDCTWRELMWLADWKIELQLVDKERGE